MKFKIIEGILKNYQKGEGAESHTTDSRWKQRVFC